MVNVYYFFIISPKTLISSLKVLHTIKMLWTDKYKPQKREDLVGCGPQYSSLVAWFKSRPKIKMLALLAGPVGVGKTAMVDLLVAEMAMRNVLRVNTLGKKIGKVIGEIEHAFDSRTVDAFFTGKMQKAKPNLIVIDEVDTITAGTAGALSKIVSFAKTTKVPIVCTANDTNLKSIKTLADSAHLIRMVKPSGDVLSARLVQILKFEGRQMPLPAIRNLCTACGYDVRQCITELEFASKSAGSATQYVEDGSFSLDREMAPFDFMPHLFRPKPNLQMVEKFEGEEMVSMLVEENIVRTACKDPSKLAEAMDMISLADVLKGPTHTMLSCYGPCSKLASGVLSRPEFPIFLTKTASISSNWKVFKDMAGRIKPFWGAVTISSQMLHYLHVMLVQPVCQKGQAQTVAELMNAIGMDIDDWEVIELIGSFPHNPKPATPIVAKKALAKLVKARTANIVQKKGGPPAKKRKLDDDDDNEEQENN